MSAGLSPYRLSELFAFSTEKNEKNDFHDVLTISAEHGLVSQKDFFSKSVSSQNLSNYYVVRKDSFAYNRSFSNGYPAGAIKRLKIDQPGLVSPIYFVLNVKPEARSVVDLDYLESVLESGALNLQIKSVSHEGARGHGLLNIRRDEFMKLVLYLPPLETQSNIARAILAHDASLEATKKNVICAEQLKRGLTQQLFSNKASRFKFTQTTLAAIAQISTGSTPSTSKAEYYNNGRLPFIKTGEIKGERIQSAQTFITEQALRESSMSLFPKGTILLAMYGQGKTRGNVALLDIEATTTQNAAVIQPLEGIDPEYLFHLLKSMYSTLRGEGIYGHIAHLNLGLVKQIKVQIPEFTAQRKIAAVFDAIDLELSAYNRLEAKQFDLKRALIRELPAKEIA